MNNLHADDDDEDDILVQELVFSECDNDESLFGLMVPAVAFCRPERRMMCSDERCNGIWDEHVVKCRHKGTFVSKYHMTEDSFNNRVDELSAKILLLVSNRLTSDSLMLPGCAGWGERIIPAWRRV
jgi:hypothetical protein